MAKERDWYSPKEVAEQLDVTEDTIWNWLKTKKIPGYRFGGRWRINKAEFEKWRKEQRNIQDEE
jgi:excisionase family DNA binding protein